MFGVCHRNDRGAVADTARPPGNLGDVENRVAPLKSGRLGTFGHGVIRTQDQVGYTDVEAAIQAFLAVTRGMYLAEGDGKPAYRFPLQVVVELTVVVPVQRGAIATLARCPGHAFGAHPRHGGDRG